MVAPTESPIAAKLGTTSSSSWSGLLPDALAGLMVQRHGTSLLTETIAHPMELPPADQHCDRAHPRGSPSIQRMSVMFFSTACQPWTQSHCAGEAPPFWQSARRRKNVLQTERQAVRYMTRVGVWQTDSSSCARAFFLIQQEPKASLLFCGDVPRASTLVRHCLLQQSAFFYCLATSRGTAGVWRAFCPAPQDSGLGVLVLALLRWDQSGQCF